MSQSLDSQNPEPDPMTIDPSNLGSVDPLSVEGLFLVALGKKGDKRAAFLAESCPDAEQRQRVEALLAAYESAGSFLQKPAINAEPTPVGQYLAPCEIPGTLGRLGPYEILEEIGRGGMGVVFRAHDPKLQRIVAVKALAPELARLPSARQRFLREARAAAAISHPHVVTIFAVDGTEEASLGTERTTLPYLVMECIVGQTLHDKIKRVGALKTEEIVRISRQIAEGLTAAHKRGLIHRDIKPANILLENGVERVKITDFGLARTTSDGGITHTGEILGTPQCMSPEQARGELVDQRSDLFSLGCVMYTMCTGVSPFRADNMLAVMKKVCEVTPRPVAELNPAIPEWLGQLVHQLLEKLPEGRVQTAGDVVQVLESQSSSIEVRARLATAPEPVCVPQPSPGLTRLSKLARWQRWLPTVVLVSGMIGFVLGQNDSSFMMMLPVWGALVWGVLSWAKLGLKLDWPWIQWRAVPASVLALFGGANLRVWFQTGCQLTNTMIDTENFLRRNAGVFVFPLAIVIFWLLTRWFPGLFISTQTQPLSNKPLATTQARSPWSVLGWLLVGLLGVGFLGGLMLAVALAVTYFATSSDPVVPRGHGTILLQIPPGENVKYVTIDGQQAIMSPGGDRLWATHATPGSHTLYVDFDSISALNQIKTFKTTINVHAGQVTNVDAVPVVQVDSANYELTVPAKTPQSDMGGKSSGMMGTAGGMAIDPTPAAPPSIPLGDAVEVLSDVEHWPRYPYSNLMASQRTHVWIDEPGLIIRLKPLDFDGGEKTSDEYSPVSSWGVGYFQYAGDATHTAIDLPPGRYRVLVQDIDYGWDLDRRGTIVIGQGKQTIHVKRSFSGQQLTPVGEGANFRWAGLSYRIKKSAEMNAVNQMLAAMSGEKAEAEKYGIGYPEVDFTGHTLAEQLTQLQPGPNRQLMHVTRVMRVEIPPGLNIERVEISTPLVGLISWTRSSPREFHVPFGTLNYEVFYQRGFSWPGSGSQIDLVPESIPNQTLVARGMTKAMMRRMIDANRHESGQYGSYLGWFEDQPINLGKQGVKAAERLVLAWLDGQPDVAEAELLQLGMVETWEKLWENGQSGSPEKNMISILIPGQTPGTWRLKEPPAGSIVETATAP